MARVMQGFTAELVLDARAEAGESPWWCVTEQKLYWVDIHGCRLHRFDVMRGVDEEWPTPDLVTFVAPHASGGLVVALRDRVSFIEAPGAVFRTVALPPIPNGGRLNDGAVDASGRLWIGAMVSPETSRVDAKLYRIDHDGQCVAVLNGFRTVNGLAFSHDSRTMYVSDSHPQVRTVWRFDYDLATGTPHNRRVFVDTRNLPGRPDGGCVDDEGAYWMTAIDGGCVLRFGRDGALLTRVTVPVEKPSKAVFGGRDLDCLFITSLRRNLQRPQDAQPHAGALFMARVNARGFPQPPCSIALHNPSSK